MSLYAYIITHDTGFAPNPFWGYCTLACCKPSIRKKAEKNDWIVGLSPKTHGNQIIYAMRVETNIPMGEYYQDRQFERKKTPEAADYKNKPMVYQRGDNIYKPIKNNEFQQLPSMHSTWKIDKEGSQDLLNLQQCMGKCKPIPLQKAQQTRYLVSENSETKKRDLGGKNVLIAREFYYFGSDPLIPTNELYKELEKLKLGIGHRVINCPKTMRKFISFITSHNPGVNAPPTIWPSYDHSWRTGQP